MDSITKDLWWLVIGNVQIGRRVEGEVEDDQFGEMGGSENLKLQALAAEHGEKIETVNRERKFQQQNAGNELNVLSAQWRELCLKNIEIQEACVKIESHLEELRKEAAERGWNLDVNMENGSLGYVK
uniref:Uncharacterized protein n=1 Tax=Chenopodium quinoa TaxID=63459 RepID=A0A803MIK5_CHEQI